MLDKNSKIYVAGHHGLVGSAIWNNLKARGYKNLVGRTHRELDLTDQLAVRKLFDEERPDAVVLAAAFVGGIMANSLYRADFIMQNMKMQCNVISESYAHGVKKLLFLGSTCIYPKNAPQPMKEDSLLTSPLEYTNEEYAIAKIAGLKMCESYNLQYGTNYIAVMPTNLYGPNDNFHLENSHVMPAMMRKVFLAKLIHDQDWDAIRSDLDKRPVTYKSQAPQGDGAGVGSVTGSSSEDEILTALAQYGIFNNKVVLWGTGTPLREFLWSEDMADASVHVLLNVNFSDIIGIEKYSSVLVRALDKRPELESDNLYFIRMDAEEICDVFAEGEVDRIYLNFSDPWPKERHAQRRLPSASFLRRYEEVLVPDGRVSFKTDNEALFDFALAELSSAGWEAEIVSRDLHADEALSRDNVMTEYEARFVGLGKPIFYTVIHKRKGG